MDTNVTLELLATGTRWSVLAYNSRAIIYRSSVVSSRFITYEGPIACGLREISWSLAPTSIREISYNSLSNATVALRELSYLSPSTLAVGLREILYKSPSDAAVVLRELSWTTTSVNCNVRSLPYKSVQAAFSNRALVYNSEFFDGVVFNVRDITYRSNELNAQLISLTVPEITINGFKIPVNSINITADEDSNFYQCSIELSDPNHYTLLPRDSSITFDLFGTSYAFIVDNRSLQRSISDDGMLQLTSSISGLSPLCRYTSPRATKITKTWDTATNASAIVTELLGSVTWNLVDWVIPAYRFAADNAAPLELAKQIVEAAGGLIESQPDGSIVCRHRWPVSIADFGTATPDKTLYETRIYSSDESPANDILVDKVHILDQEASYQDRLEYVANKLADGTTDDPRHGILYAYLSPWRDSGISFATTRPSVILLGEATEGTRTIEGDNSEIVTFTEGSSSVQYPVMSLNSVQWLDDDLGSVTVTPFSTSLTAGKGTYGGYSIARIAYVTKFYSIPVTCTEPVAEIEAQFLLLEEQV